MKILEKKTDKKDPHAEFKSHVGKVMKHKKDGRAISLMDFKVVDGVPNFVTQDDHPSVTGLCPCEDFLKDFE